MTEFSKLALALGGFNAMFAVILGAFGAHGLKLRLTPELMSVYQTAVQYHFYHAIGLLVIGILIFHIPDSIWLRRSAWLMLSGIVLFSGSLYLLAVTDTRWLGAITPIGGLAFILAWLTLIIGIIKN